MTHRLHPARLAALLFCAAAGCSSDDPNQTQTGTVSGVVIQAQSGAPAAAATISIGSRQATSAADGSFTVTGVRYGSRELIVAKTGFDTLHDTLTIATEQVALLPLSLTALTVPLTPLGVVALPDSVPGNVRLSWSATSGAASYVVYWSSTPLVRPEGTNGLTTPGTNLVQTGLSEGVKYYYAVSAVGGSGEASPLSQVVGATAGSTISLELLQPTTGALVDSMISIQARAISETQIQSFTATVAGRQIAMVPVSPGYWGGSISLNGLPSPQAREIALLLVAANNDSAEATIGFRHDRPPTVKFLTPFSDDLARPTIPVHLTCADDGPGCTVQLSVYDGDHSVVQLVGPTVGEINQSISLPQYDGRRVELRGGVRDSAGQTRVTAISILVDINPRLVEVAHYSGAGLLLAADQQHLLAIDTARTGDTLRIIDRSTHTGPAYFFGIHDAYATYTEAVLTSAGAFLHSDSLFELRNGILTRLSGFNESPRVELPYLIYNVGNLLVRRDLTTGNGDVLTEQVLPRGYDVASNGDMVFLTPNGQVRRWRSGTTTSITNGSGFRALRTDGDGILAVKQDNPCCGSVTQSLVLLAGGNETEVLPMTLDQLEGRHWDLVNGWAAYEVPGPGGISEVRVRSPAGVITQASPQAAACFLDLLAPDGEVIFTNFTLGKRFRTRPGQPAEAIGSWLGKPLYINGSLHIILGHSLLQVQ